MSSTNFTLLEIQEITCQRLQWAGVSDYFEVTSKHPIGPHPVRDATADAWLFGIYLKSWRKSKDTEDRFLLGLSKAVSFWLNKNPEDETTITGLDTTLNLLQAVVFECGWEKLQQIRFFSQEVSPRLQVLAAAQGGAQNLTTRLRFFNMAWLTAPQGCTDKGVLLWRQRVWHQLLNEIQSNGSALTDLQTSVLAQLVFVLVWQGNQQQQERMQIYQWTATKRLDVDKFIENLKWQERLFLTAFPSLKDAKPRWREWQCFLSLNSAGEQVAEGAALLTLKEH